MNQLKPETVKRLMRQNGKTIRSLAAQMNVSMTRVRQVRQVRQVREEGVEGQEYCRDWLEALTTITTGGPDQATSLES
jgi:transcriptional regulator with XRE-family HTH domain